MVTKETIKTLGTLLPPSGARTKDPHREGRLAAEQFNSASCRAGLATRLTGLAGLTGLGLADLRSRRASLVDLETVLASGQLLEILVA